MKRLLLSIGVITLLITPVSAHATLDCSSELGAAILNECQEHTVDTDTNTHRDNDFGQIIEGKVKVYKYKNVDVNTKVGFDTANDNSYAILQFDYKTDDGVLQKPIDKTVGGVKKVLDVITFGIFTKGE